ncbi:MAG: amidohydrolase family protein [Proteobacteria bacterium]|nr:amidohydrolase family protein [Pseudomonadota bacterium]
MADGLSARDIFVRHGLIAEGDAGTPCDSVRDLGGLFVIPGLIDAHVHLCLNPAVRDPLAQSLPEDAILLGEMRERALAMLRAGITSARDLGGGAHLELRIRDEIREGLLPGPRLLCAGQPVTSPGGHCHFWGGEAASVEEALSVVERQRSHGVDLIKIMATGGNITPGSKPVDSQFDDETLQQVVSRAGQYSYHVAAHCHGTHGIRQATLAGVQTIEHCSWVGENGWGRGFDPSVVAQMSSRNLWVSPTINSGWRRFQDEAFVEMVRGNYDRMKAAGIRLIASTDAGIPNIYHDDLPRALPEFARFAGLSPVEVLKTATSECAEAIGLGKIAGRIKAGYSADFVAYDRNPLADLGVLENPVMVVARGEEIAL